MRTRNGTLFSFFFMALVTALPCAGATPATGPTLTTLFRFGGKGGAYPGAGMVFGANGALYGTTMQGGTADCGVVFQLTPPAGGKGPWTEAAIYSVTGSKCKPWAPGSLIFDSSGSLYGASANGGLSGHGMVFQLTPVGGGGWAPSVLYNFTGGTGDGSAPAGALLLGLGGVLYGVTKSGGANNLGTVYQLTPPAEPGGVWNEAVLYSFGQTGDGTAPAAGLIVNAAGVLYGTTSTGGATNNGTVYSLTPPSSPGGAWTEAVIYSFAGGTDGSQPQARLAMEKSGALFGTTAQGGASTAGNLGTVFKLVPPKKGTSTWTELVLYSFQGGNDGANPLAGIVTSGSGSLFGTTSAGGFAGLGTFFEVTPPATTGQPWTETVLHVFDFSDGSLPLADLAVDSKGALYGTTLNGGTPERGTIYKLKP